MTIRPLLWRLGEFVRERPDVADAFIVGACIGCAFGIAIGVFIGSPA
jgi:hypothetical protein